ncbi:unnamed protein product [Didymodactylos carnosus]|uniref:Uncharacterized protein n=1 Tax=Didymodactylos carnosus TaxID=1234261 RepID=A0A8S2GY86_9BILA|nr:unnamed protein product [Didymodactylos carnosus]CAF3553582.1 unnamed protein product [Didymodactylos carnosus]
MPASISTTPNSTALPTTYSTGVNLPHVNNLPATTSPKSAASSATTVSPRPHVMNQPAEPDAEEDNDNDDDSDTISVLDTSDTFSVSSLELKEETKLVPVASAEATQEFQQKFDQDQKKRNEEIKAEQTKLQQEVEAEKKRRVQEDQQQQQRLDLLVNQQKEAEVQKQIAEMEQARKKSEASLKEATDRLKKLEQQLASKDENDRKLKDLAKRVKTIEYRQIDRALIKDYLAGKVPQITAFLNTIEQVDEYFRDRIPRLDTMEDHAGNWKLVLSGFQKHHDAFSALLLRLQKLVRATQSAKEYYRRHLRRQKSEITGGLRKAVKGQKQISVRTWQHYRTIFMQLVKQKIEDYGTAFDQLINQKQKSSWIDNAINGEPVPRLLAAVKQETDNYVSKKPFLKEVNELKHQTFETYIDKEILVQQVKFEKIPSTLSTQVMNEFIARVKQDFKTTAQQNDKIEEQFKPIPKLLKRMQLYYRCFLLQLPLYESAKDLLRKIEKNTVVTIATSTGSVIVTQPRRLPCNTICDRVNETMIANRQSEQALAGWAVSGAEKNVNAPILYLTDGLLKERLQYDENLINNQTKFDKSLVFFIDEVHERSINIDLCLALFARLLTQKPHLRNKIKLIISSATLDTSVPDLFRKIQPKIEFTEFVMPQMGLLYPVNKVDAKDKNLLKVVQELYKKKSRHDQILVFVSSVTEVHQSVRLLTELSKGAIVAYPLVQSQAASDQQNFIEVGSVFISTTVAETSLTFPGLKYVIDTGMINVPVYDVEKKQTILKEIRAAESTIKQRLGRLGRTKPGEYYSLYDFKVEDKRYPTPQICQSDLTNLEFSLRKSPLKNGLSYLKTFLPNPPDEKRIQAAMNELKLLLGSERSILTPQYQLSSVGVDLSKLPDFGSLAMAKAVLSALQQYNCGRDLIVLSSILGILNTSAILKQIPPNLKSADGDFMSLLNVMDTVLQFKQSVPAKQFSLDKICKSKGLTSIQHYLRQAVRRYSSLEQSFNLSDIYKEKAQVKSGDWSLIAKALLNGFSENVFVSMKELQGKLHLFVRYHQQSATNTDMDLAVLDLQSTLVRPMTQAPVSLVLARDIRFSSSIRATAVLSFLGELKSEWIEKQMVRQFTLNDAELAKLNADGIVQAVKNIFSNINITTANNTIKIQGSSGAVLDAELDIRKQLVVEHKFRLKNEYPKQSASYQNLKRNLESVSKMATRIFNPMIWRWERQEQVKITIDGSSTESDDICEVTVLGRDSQNQLVEAEFNSFLTWLKNSVVLRHPNSGVEPRRVKSAIRKECADIEERISHVTDTGRSTVDLWNSLNGPSATRETRMEFVAWLSVCEFHCRLEGGFVRDWIVGHCSQKPSTPIGWIKWEPNSQGKQIPYLNKDFIPSDLDMHLPTHNYFDIDKFLDRLHKYQITYQVIREDWRYVILLDENRATGPFTMDLIEPHVALTHDRVDFDVSNLSLEEGCTRELGMRVDITQKPYSIELETIIDNIKNKRFQVLRPNDNIVRLRIGKMVDRGWTQVGQPMHIIPNPPPKYSVVLVPLHSTTTLYQELSTKMKKIPGCTIVSMEQIKNPLLEDAYQAMKMLIAKQCPGRNPNQMELFHGTKGEAIEGILNDGFDDRFFNATGA